jgi:hypothetical protein
VSLCYKLSPFQAHWGRWHCTHFLRPSCLFTAHVGGGSFPQSCWVFLPPPLTSFPAPGCWVSIPFPASLACLFTVLERIPFPQSSALSVPHPLSHVSLLFLLLITKFYFFPRVEVSLSRWLCCSGPGLSVGVPRTAQLTLWSTFSQAVWARATGGLLNILKT